MKTFFIFLGLFLLVVAMPTFIGPKLINPGVAYLESGMGRVWTAVLAMVILAAVMTLVSKADIKSKG